MKGFFINGKRKVSITTMNSNMDYNEDEDKSSKLTKRNPFCYSRRALARITPQSMGKIQTGKDLSSC